MGNPALDAALSGILTSRWTARGDSTRTATAAELALDPGRPALVWKQDATGVRFHGASPPREPKHSFA